MPISSILSAMATDAYYPVTGSNEKFLDVDYITKFISYVNNMRIDIVENHPQLQFYPLILANVAFSSSNWSE